MYATRLRRLPYLVLATSTALAITVLSTSASGQTALISSMILIPQSPGGAEGNAPCYALEELPPARFDVLLDDELQGEPLDYYRNRARLAAATYQVHVYGRSSYQPLWKGKPSRPVAVLGPDAHGSFRLDQAGLEPGGDYLWLAAARIDDGRGSLMLWSVPLYFKLLPQPETLPPALGEAAYPLRQLLIQKSAQARASTAASSALEGLAPYYNFAAASDSFICAPLVEGGPSPAPDAAAGPALTFGALLATGDVAAQALALLRSSTLEAGQLARLGTAVRSLALTLTGQIAPSSGSALVEAGDKLGSPGTDGPAAVSQLMIAVDGVLGTGTRTKLKTGVESFPPFARRTNHRIEALQEYAVQIKGTLGEHQWQQWDGYLRQIRGELTLMADDIERGRMNLDQLKQQLAAARQISQPLYARDWRFLNADGTLIPERVERLKIDETEQRRRLAEELYWYHLKQFSEVLLPQVQP